ncbi:hypothetical protein [Tumebacillus permanentifrigoris]|uniref:ATP-binding sugar transporter Gifsy-2 n=1 Tax=Tumebacillus permanentifrigoris TaxID=378543 RepID=A0A316DCZ5_9BACL|nr:hypothetical protein [Tumebacillus permanentifrigoris]PWK16067.1 ATP-binding sugar transporter Gifsy-2 [Tumebacillus permanentifrigoris]
MSFKDSLNADIRAVFLNPDEFAEIHLINGKETPCIIDFSASGTDFEGTYVKRLTLYVEPSKLDKKPIVDGRLRIGDKHYTVISVSETSGLLDIGLEANES